MKILKYKYIYIIFSSILIFLSFLSVGYFGFNLSIDFKGGVLYEISYTEKAPKIKEVSKKVSEAGINNAIVQKTGEKNFVIKAESFKENQKEILKESLKFEDKFSFTEEREKEIGPSISSELKNKSFFAILFVAIVIIIFIKFAFAGVSRPVSSFKYGLVAIVALIHDIIIPTGIFAILGAFYLNYQIDILFVTALLAILGFSVNDTIVVFDRIRENLKNSKEKNIKGEKFEKIVENSLNQTITRSANTSLTTLFVLACLYFIGGETLQPFALVLMLGVIVGTYSSIFLASPLLILIEKYQKEVNFKEEKEEEKAEYVATEKDIQEALERMQNEK